MYLKKKLIFKMKVYINILLKIETIFQLIYYKKISEIHKMVSIFYPDEFNNMVNCILKTQSNDNERDETIKSYIERDKELELNLSDQLIHSMKKLYKCPSIEDFIKANYYTKIVKNIKNNNQSYNDWFNNYFSKTDEYLNYKNYKEHCDKRFNEISIYLDDLENNSSLEKFYNDLSLDELHYLGY